MRIGVISDTHGFLDARVYNIFENVQHILHAGDVGDDQILDELQLLAPVNAVSGNVDFGLTKHRPQKWCGQLFGLKICMTHGHLLDPYDYNKSAAEFFNGENPDIIIHGHSHKARLETYQGITMLNPGASCKPRFRDVASVAIIEIPPGRPFHVEFRELTRTAQG